MRLVKIDLTKANKHDHPDIKVGKTYYLAKISKRMWLGKFSRQHFGLNFDDGYGTYGVGHQFDAPGYNASSWKELYEVVED